MVGANDYFPGLPHGIIERFVSFFPCFNKKTIQADLLLTADRETSMKKNRSDRKREKVPKKGGLERKTCSSLESDASAKNRKKSLRITTKTQERKKTPKLTAAEPKFGIR